MMPDTDMPSLKWVVAGRAAGRFSSRQIDNTTPLMSPALLPVICHALGDDADQRVEKADEQLDIGKARACVPEWV
jgi:hypothetical protein